VRQIPRAAPHNLPQSAGHPAHVEFPTFRALNLGQARLSGVVGAKSILKVPRASRIDFFQSEKNLLILLKTTQKSIDLRFLKINRNKFLLIFKNQ
jgi:hypothetical protein